MKRHTYRAWGQTAILAAGLLVFLLISIAMLTDDKSKSQPFTIAMYSVIGAGSIVGLWLALRMGVVVTDTEIRLRAVGRGSVIPWSQVVAVTCETYDTRAGNPLYGPVLHILTPGKPDVALPLTVLGSYRRAVAEERTRTLAALHEAWTTGPDVTAH